jgi:hypothetical protein
MEGVDFGRGDAAVRPRFEDAFGEEEWARGEELTMSSGNVLMV